VGAEQVAPLKPPQLRLLIHGRTAKLLVPVPHRQLPPLFAENSIPAPQVPIFHEFAPSIIVLVVLVLTALAIDCAMDGMLHKITVEEMLLVILTSM
jgi:hypothetical protein